jgi:hypothetical protein
MIELVDGAAAEYVEDVDDAESMSAPTLSPIAELTTPRWGQLSKRPTPRSG